MSTPKLADPDDDLGPVIVSCRRLSALQSLRARGLSSWGAWQEHYIFVPLVSLMLTLPCLAGIVGLIGQDRVSETLGPPLRTAIWFATAVPVCWLIYTWHHHDYFVLHENGLRIRIGLKRLRVRFEALVRVSGLMPEGLIEAEYERLGRYYDREPDDVERSLPRLASGSVAIELADGRPRVFRALLRFEPADVARLLVALEQVHDEWWPQPEE